MTTKEKAITLIQSLDDNVSMDDLIDRLYLASLASNNFDSGLSAIENCRAPLGGTSTTAPQVETRRGLLMPSTSLG
ncbi:MAG: hypothetical protein KDB22_00835 [Planctomycetales bacterium]|nr:hypothetical protein [Planctomycetales bacterium]